MKGTGEIMGHAYDLDDADDTPAEPSRRRVVLMAVGAGVVVAGCLAVAGYAIGERRQADAALAEAEALAGRRPVPGGGKGAAAVVPSPTVEGEQWTHKELVAYLRSKGLDVELESDRVGGMVAPSADVIAPDGGRIAVQKRATAAEARDQAGASDRTFAWGRFFFHDRWGSPNLSASIQSTLGVR